MKKIDQREQTISALVAIARDQFAEHGFSGVALEDIVAAAGVTRGALYHHFENKKGLFRAVLDDVARDVGARIAAAAEAESDEWSATVAGCHAFLGIALEPRIARILLIDAPAVLGWETWRQVDEQNAMSLLREQLKTLADAGMIQTPSVEALAHLLSGAMNELALWIAGSAQSKNTLVAATETLDGILEHLKHGMI